MKSNSLSLTRPLLSWLVGLCVTTLTLTAVAIPTELTVQGRLTNAAGQPAEGNYSLQASLYDAPDNGAKLVWTDTFDITVSNGVFDITLGSDPINPLVPADFASSPQMWLGVKVQSGPGVPPQGDNELPRRPITTVGYAFAAQTAQSAQSVNCQNCIDANSLAFDPVTEAELSQSLGDLQIPSGSCPDGEAITSIEDGNITCGQIANNGGVIDQANMPLNGLNEVSNGLLSNQFVDVAKSQGTPTPVGVGITNQIVFPDIGIAENLTVSVDISTGSDLSGVIVKLIDPELVQYTLYNKDGVVPTFTATFPVPQATKDGDLTTWVGKNPKGQWTLQIIDQNLNAQATLNSWSINLQTLSNKKVAVNGNLIVSGTITGANGTTIDGELNITQGINFTDNSTVSGNIVFADRVEFKNSWCPKKPNGERSMVVGGICVAQVFGRRTAQNASLSCANIKADLCTDSQSWVLRSHGLLNANTHGANYANWTNSYSGDDGAQFRYATGNTGDDHGPSNEYVAPCCYNVTPARASDEKISSVRVIHIHDTADVTFAWASRYCTNLNADLCSKAQYQVLRDKGKISARMWSNDHSDNDSNVCNSSIGAVVDDPQPRDNNGYACCATSYKAPESVTCPEGVNETKGVCWVKTGQGSWSTAVQDCDTNGAQLCSISQNYVLRNAGIVSGSGNWTQSHSDNDGGNTNWSLGGGSDNPTDGQSYNYACCL